MNLWTDIALGNLQRVRPAPEMAEFECPRCGDTKTEDQFQVVTGDRTYRRSTCNDCRNADARARRKKNRKPAAKSNREIVLAAFVQRMTITQAVAATGLERDIVRGHVRRLLDDGLLVCGDINAPIPIYVRHESAGYHQEKAA